jgi:hypothetical protein
MAVCRASYSAVDQNSKAFSAETVGPEPRTEESRSPTRTQSIITVTGTATLRVAHMEDGTKSGCTSVLAEHLVTLEFRASPVSKWKYFPRKQTLHQRHEPYHPLHATERSALVSFISRSIECEYVCASNHINSSFHERQQGSVASPCDRFLHESNPATSELTQDKRR